MLARALVSGVRSLIPAPRSEDGTNERFGVAQIDEIDEIDDAASFRAPSVPLRHHVVRRQRIYSHQVALIGSSTSTTSHKRMTSQRGAVPRPAEGAPTANSTASGSTHPRAHPSSFAPPLSGQRSLRSRGRRSSRSADTPREGVQPQGGEIWMPLHHRYESGSVRRGRRSGTRVDRSSSRRTPGRTTTSRAARASPGGQTDAIKHLGSRSTARNRFRSLAAERQRLRPDSRRGRLSSQLVQAQRIRASYSST